MILNYRNLFSVQNNSYYGSSSDMAKPLIEYFKYNGAELILVDKKHQPN